MEFLEEQNEKFLNKSKYKIIRNGLSIALSEEDISVVKVPYRTIPIRITCVFSPMFRSSSWKSLLNLSLFFISN